MADLKAQIEITADASGVETGITSAKRSLASLGKSAEDAGKQASDGLSKIGDGGAQGADKVEQAAKNLIGSIQRTTAAMEAGSKSSADYYRVLASQRGVDVNQLKPYLDQLDAVAAKHKMAEQAMQSTVPAVDQLGMSAKQTAWAMRGIPAQMTDIVVSLQGGQKPLTVLMQQGGQLKDMFGGVGNAAKAVGSYVLGMINPFTVAAAAAAGLGAVFYLGSKEADAYSKAIILSGNAAGTTVGKMQAMAAAVAAATGATQGASGEALAALTSSAKVSANDMERFAAIAIKTQRETGAAVADTVKQFADLAKDPVAASLKLNETYNYLTLSVYEQIKALKEQGKETEAVALAQRTFASSAETNLAQIAGNLGTLEKAWRGVSDGAKRAWDSMLSVGRQASVVDQLAAAQQDLQARQQRQPLNDAPGMVEAYAKGNELLQQRIASLNEQVRLERRGAEAAAQRVATQNAALAVTDAVAKANEKGLTQQQQMNKALEEYRQNVEKIKAADPASKLIDPAKIAAAERAIRAQFAEKAKELKPDAWLTDVSKTYTKAMEDMLKVQGEAAAKADNLSRAQEKLRAVMAAPEWQAYSRQQQEQISYAASLAQAEEDREAATKAAAHALAEYTKQRETELRQYQQSADSANEHAQKLEDEVALYGKTKEAINELTIARLREEQAKQMSYGDDAAVQALEAEIEARRRLAKATDALDSRKATEKVAEEWKKTAEKINDTLTDALMRGFESGKDFAKNMRDTIVNMFKTMVLRPVISAIITPVSQGITNAFGGGQASGVGVGGQVSNAMGLNTLYGAGAQLFTGGTAGASGLSLAYANSVGSVGGDSLGALISANGGWAGVSAGAAGSLGAGSAFASGGAASGAFGVGGGMGAASGAAELAGAAAAGEAAGAAAASGASAGMAGGISSALAAVPVWGWIALGIMAIASGAKGETRSGAQFGYSFDGTSAINARRDTTVGASGIGATFLEGPSGTDISAQVAAAAINSTVTGINTLLKGVGTDARLVGFQAGLETSDNGRGGVFSGGTLSTGATFGESGKGNNYEGTLYESTSSHNVDAKTALENFQTDLMQGTIQALQAVADKASDFPKVIGDMLKGVDAEALTGDAASKLLTSINTIVSGVSNFKAALETLPFENLKNLSFDAANGLIVAAGGMEALGQKLGTYYENFYSAEEKRAQVVTNITNTLKAAGADLTEADVGGATREAFRSVVEATDPSSPLYVALLNVAGAFASITPAVDSATTALAKAQANLGQSVGFDGRTILGSADAARYASDPGFKSLIDGLQSQADIINTSMLTPDDVARRVGEFRPASGGGGGTSAIEDEASKKLASDASTFERVMSDLTNKNADIRAEMLSASGDKTGSVAITRAKELAALTANLSESDAAKIKAQFDANESLRDQIKALQESTNAAESLRDAWKGITKDLLTEVDRIRGIMASNSQDGLSALQARFAIATAQARAGDQEAAKLLTGYSSQLLSSAADQAGSRSELLALQSQVADSLQNTAVILGAPPPTLSALPDINQQPNAKLEGLVQSLTDKIANLEGRLSDIQSNTRRTADVIDGGVVITEAA